MKINFSFLKCLGFCLVFCLGLCLSQIFLSGCSTPNPRVKDSNNMQTITENETPFACNMSALNADEKKRVLELLKELKAKKQEIKELPDGYAFRYPMDNQNIRDVAEFITYERLCCPFFQFDLTIEKEDGSIWFTLKGREGVKDFIKIEFDFR